MESYKSNSMEGEGREGECAALSEERQDIKVVIWVRRPMESHNSNSMGGTGGSFLFRVANKGCKWTKIHLQKSVITIVKLL